MAELMGLEDCNFEGFKVRISDSAMIHLRYERIQTYTLCDMLSDPIDCPKGKRTGKPFRKSSRRLCAKRKGHTYNIILDKYESEGEEYWSVSHLEPI